MERRAAQPIVAEPVVNAREDTCPGRGKGNSLSADAPSAPTGAGFDAAPVHGLRSIRPRRIALHPWLHSFAPSEADPRFASLPLAQNALIEQEEGVEV